MVAADSDGNRGTMDVEVTVENEDEPGVVTLSRTQPRVGVEVTASLTDPDGSISGLRWQWYRGENIVVTSLPTAVCADDGDSCPIKDAASGTYTPVAADGPIDNGKTLQAVASYTDGHGEEKSMVGTAANDVELDTRNKPPVFGDQDEEDFRHTERNGHQGGGGEHQAAGRRCRCRRRCRRLTARADNVGGALTATDPDPNMELLIYTLSGAEAGSFRVRGNGQIEVAAGAKLDYETKDTYMVTLTAEDSFGDSASIMVTITVTDMDEAPEVAGDATAEYAENGAGSVANYTAVDPEGAAITSWTLSGVDAACSPSRAAC